MISTGMMAGKEDILYLYAGIPWSNREALIAAIMIVIFTACIWKRFRKSGKNPDHIGES